MAENVEWKLNDTGALTAYIDGVPAVWFPQPGSQEAFLQCPVFETLIAGGRGGGKRLSDKDLCLTDSGWKQVGEVNYEDKLVAIDGTYTRILGIFPSKSHELYTLTFCDGAEVVADAEHLWEVRNAKTGYKRGMQIRTTRQLLKSKEKWSVPIISEPVPGKKWTGPDPYILGLLLGDGTLTGHYTTVYSADPETIEYLRAGGWSVGQYKASSPELHMMWTGDERYRDVLGRVSKEDKHVPEELLLANPETRLAVLQGLMDADGSCDKEGRVTACSISEKLANGYVYLARSLGGLAQKHWSAPRRLTSKVKNLSGVVSEWSKPIWRINISHRNVLRPFRLKRKLDRIRETKGRQYRAIKSIEPCGIGDATCFKVEHPRKLFVVNDFVVTHNTDTMLMDFAQYVGKGFGEEWRGILFRRTFPELDDIIGKSIKWFKKIWPNANFNKATKTWEWPTGESLKFRHILRPQEYWNYHGSAYPWIGFEELTTWPNPDCYTPLFSLSRSSHPQVAKLCRIRATTNPYGCVPYGEVLTSNRGWVDIKDVLPGESVISVDKDGVACEKEVSALIKHEYDGTMIHRKGSGLNMVFTEDHRLPKLSTDRTYHTHTQFNELPRQANIRAATEDWLGEKLDYFSPPEIKMRKSRSKVPDRISGMDLAELLGWLVSEGSARYGGHQFQIAQMKGPNRDQIQELLDRCGFTYTASFNQFQIHSKRWTQWAASLGCSSRFKMLPAWFLRCEKPLLQKCFEAAMLGDGDKQNRYYTLSRVLADQMLEVGVKLGYKMRLTSRTRSGRKYRGYTVSFKKRKSTELITGGKHINIQKEQFSGTVYCLTVPGTESFFIRQDGFVWCSSNSGHNWVKKRFGLPMGEGMLIGSVIKDTRTDIPKDERELPRVAIRSSLYENKILLLADPGYVGKIRSAARNPAELAAWIDGSWDISSGGMFDDIYDENIHVIPDIPYILLRKAGWFLNRAYDHGLSKPFSVGWWAQSNGNPITLYGKEYGEVKGDLFLFNEYYGCTGDENKGLNMPAREIARQIKVQEKEMGLRGRIKRGPADSSIFSRYDGNQTVAGDMKKEGVYWDAVDKSPGSRVQGWQQIRTLLKGALPVKGGVREDKGIFICERCADSKRTVPCLSRDDKNLDDVNSETEDHAGDMWRYRLRWTRRTITQRKW